MSTNFLLILILFTDTSNIADIHKYLMKKKRYKIMFQIIFKMCIILLSSIVNVSNHTKMRIVEINLINIISNQK